MNKLHLQALRRLARWHGVLTEYTDVSGRPVRASPENLQAMLGVLGVSLENFAKAPGLLQQTLSAQWLRPLEPVTVAWQEAGGHVEVRLPRKHFSLQGRIRLETGEAESLSLAKAPVVAAAQMNGVKYECRRIRLPPGIQCGYHTLELEGVDFSAQSRLLVAPQRVWEPKPRPRSWGAFLPLYALPGARGSGDYSALRELMEWTAAQGGKMVSTLPLLPLFLPDDPSPYSPLSKLFWNEFYVDVTAVPEWSAGGRTRRGAKSHTIAGARAELRSEWIDYSSALASKRKLLEGLAEFFFSNTSQRRAEFERWLNPEVRSYGQFRALTEAHGMSWSRWPERLQQRHIKDGDFDPRVLNYHLYVQWLAQQQMAALSQRSRALGVQLYLDMPLGVHREGYDVWRHPGLFAGHASGGAPPDAVFTKGQDWGFAPLHPQRLREQGYQYVIDYLRHHLRHAGALRFDHVMALHRLYWIPQGGAADQGAYVQYQSEELYAILSLESHRYQSLIVGENLGTVPPAVNKSLRRHGLREMYVVQYEMRPQVSQALRRVPARAVASMNTHDMPMFAAFFAELDLKDREALGLLAKSALQKEVKLRRRMRLALQRFLRGGGWWEGQPSVAGLLLACLAFLSASRAEWVLINLEDLWLETRSQNTPGTTVERINWRGRSRFGLEELSQQPEVAAALRTVARWRNKTRAS